MSQVKQVFISYDSADTIFAHRLAEDLKRCSMEVWIAPESIHPSEDWVDAINRGLKESSHMVTVLTPSALESTWVNLETNVAIKMERQGQLKLIPLDVEPCNPPPLWTNFQMIRFRDQYENGLSQLAAALGFVMEPEKPKPRPEPSPEPTPPQISMSILKRVREIVAEQIGVDIANVRPETDLIDDLYEENFEIVLQDIKLKLEDEFDIVIKPEESFDWNTKSLKLHTVRDWAAYIVQRKQTDLPHKI